MKKIEKIRYDFDTNGLVEDVVLKLNEIIETVNYLLKKRTEEMNKLEEEIIDIICKTELERMTYSNRQAARDIVKLFKKTKENE